MRIKDLVLTLTAFAVPLAAQQPAPATGSKPAVLDQQAQTELHASAMKFVTASDTRQRLEQNLDKLLGDGKQSMLTTNPLMNPKFADEWLKRMRTRVNLDEFVSATARTYEKYFTCDDLEELTKGQLAMKRSQVYSLSPDLAQKLKSRSVLVQHDINVETSIIGGRVGKEVGEEIEKEHPEWVTPSATAKLDARKK
jgi:uncharacterized protein (DUF1810 family)